MSIRKISIGIDYKSSMHFVSGQNVLGDSYIIDVIIKNDDGSFDIWIKKNGEVVKWKTFGNTVPTIIEYKIDF